MHTGAASLLERDHELAALAAAAAATRAGDGRVVVVRGVAGIGKTTLLRAARAAAAQEGLLTLSARGVELEREFAFGAVRQLLERAAREGAVELFDGPAALAAPLFGVGTPRGAPVAPTTDEAGFAVVHGLYWLTANLARRRPLALIVDDVQWVDASSLRFLAYVAGRLDGLDALLVLAERTGEAGGASVPRELAGADATVVLRPAPLSATAARRLVRAALPDADPALCAACHAAAAGNPLFLRELIGALRDAGPQRSPDVLARAPDGVRATVAARVARLPAAARAVGQAVAVLGSDVLLRHAAAVAGMGPEAAAAAADQLADADLLERGRPLRFVHPIVRAAVLHDVPPATLTAAHASAARLLAADHAPAERVAAHLLATDPQGDAWVAAVLAGAARSALERGAPEAAVAYLRRALDEPPDDAQRPATLLELGHAEALAFQPLPAIEHLRGGIALSPDPDVRLRAATMVGMLMANTTTVAEGVAFLDETLAGADGADPALVDEVEGHLAAFARSDLVARHTAEDRMAALLRRAQSGGTDAPSALAAFAADLAMRGEHADAVTDAARRALAARERLGRHAGDFTVPMAARCLVVADRLDEAAEALDAEIAALGARGAHLLAVPHRVILTDALRRRGRLRDAERVGREALADARAWRLGLPAAVSALALVLIERDRAEEAAALLRDDAVVATSAPFRDSYQVTMALHARGVTRLALGDVAGAAGDLIACGERLAAIDEHNPAPLAWRSPAARALLATGDAAAARRLAGEELAAARAFGAPRAMSIALRTLAAVEPGEAALAALREAVEITEVSPAQTAHAGALADLGAALLESGAVAEAVAALTSALTLARRCDAAALGRRVTATLTAAGHRPPRRPDTGPAALTRAERRVATLALQGLANREIAEFLVVTVRTVEFHLTRVYRKLGISSRRELAAVLASAEADG